MSYLEAIEIIVNYVEVMDEGKIKNRMCDIINRDFILKEDDLTFLNELIQDNDVPLNIIVAIQKLMR